MTTTLVDWEGWYWRPRRASLGALTGAHRRRGAVQDVDVEPLLRNPCGSGGLKMALVPIAWPALARTRRAALAWLLAS